MIKWKRRDVKTGVKGHSDGVTRAETRNQPIKHTQQIIKSDELHYLIQPKDNSRHPLGFQDWTNWKQPIGWWANKPPKRFNW